MMMHACNVNVHLFGECGIALGEETEHKIDCELVLPWMHLQIFAYAAHLSRDTDHDFGTLVRLENFIVERDSTIIAQAESHGNSQAQR